MTTLILLAMGVMALNCLASPAPWKPAVALRRQARLNKSRLN